MKLVTCNRGCGTDNLHWKYPEGKYKLFDENDLMHICEDGVIKNTTYREKATANLLKDLVIDEPANIPLPHDKEKKVPIKQIKLPRTYTKEPSKTFSITTNATGIAITGNDTHTAVYISKPAIRELTKALVDFV